MKTAIVTAKIEPKIKAAAERAARDLGVSLSFVINRALREFSETKTLQLSPNPKMVRRLKKQLEDSKQGRNIEGPFYSTEEFIKSLDE